MKKIECTFYRPEEPNLAEFSNIIGKMKADLHTICAEEVSTESVYQYVYDLARAARPLEYKPEMSFLGLDDPNNMPSDARVDFFYRPTYIGTAIIIRAILLHPELWDEGKIQGWEHEADCRKELKKAFPGLLKGSTARHFSGAGSEALLGMIEALRIFAEAGTGEFVEKYPDICSEFTELYRDSVQELRSRVAMNAAHGRWGEDYTEEAKETLRIIEG